jgi:hypothetical protein
LLVLALLLWLGRRRRGPFAVQIGEPTEPPARIATAAQPLLVAPRESIGFGP